MGCLGCVFRREKRQSDALRTGHCAVGRKLFRWIPTANTSYQVGSRLRMQDPAGQSWTNGARLGAYGGDSYMAASTQGLRDTQGWTQMSVRFITGKTTQAKITCTLGEADPLYADRQARGRCGAMTSR